MTTTSSAVDWDVATDALVDTLRELIRIPSINPPTRRPGTSLPS